VLEGVGVKLRFVAIGAGTVGAHAENSDVLPFGSVAVAVTN
jgi:hypothetical protein